MVDRGLADPRRPPLAERLTGSLAAMTPAAWARVDVVVAAVAFVGLVTPVLLGHPSQEGGRPPSCSSEPAPSFTSP
jgi:hypothetical protein